MFQPNKGFPIEKKLPVKVNGKNIQQIKYEGHFNREGIQNKADALSKILHKKGLNGSLMIMTMNNDNPRVGDWTLAGDKVDIFTWHEYEGNYNGVDQDDFRGFSIYISKTPIYTGGADDKNNDCLWNCLLRVVLFDDLPWNTPAQFKEFLQLDRTAKVPIDKIPIIEQKLRRYKINVRGDIVRISTLSAPYEINLTLENQHFTYGIDHGKRWHPKNTAWEKKVPLFYKRDGMEKTCCELDRPVRPLLDDEWNDIQDDKNSRNILISVPKKETFEEAQENFFRIAKGLRTESKGLIELCKTGTYVATALDLFDRFTKHIVAEELQQDEAEWIIEASYSPMIFAEEYHGVGYKADFISKYPSIQYRKTFMCPIKRGTFKKITNEAFQKYIIQNELAFGIYRCDIPYDETKRKQFTWNRKKKYCTKDVILAKKVGLNPTLIIDDQPNFLHYPRNTVMNGNAIFGQYVDTVYPLKKNGVEGAKDILNVLWGALCGKDKLSLVINENQTKEEEIFSGRKIVSILPIGKEHLQFKFTNNKHIFKTPFARIMPFLMCQARVDLSEVMRPHLDSIHWIYADGFISDKKLDLNYGDQLGDLKYVGKCDDCHVNNCTSVTGADGKKAVFKI